MSTLNHGKSKILDPFSWTCFIPENEYHEASANGEVMSSGMLKEFRLCPARYRDLTLRRAARRDTDAFRFGRAVHKLLLEGEAALAAAFAVGGPLNRKTGRSFAADSKAFDDWLRECGLDRQAVLTESEAATMHAMCAAARAHPEVARLFAAGRPERSARGEVEGVPCQTRLDWLRPDAVAVDLKTVEDIARFEGDARRFGYLHQFAFYRDVARAAGGGELDMVAVVVEKKPPFRTGVWNFPVDTLAPYVAQNRATLAAYKRCRDENRWPTGYEKPRAFPLAGIPPLWLN